MMLPCGKPTVIPIGWGSSSGTQVSGSAPAGGMGYTSLQGRADSCSAEGACMVVNKQAR